MIQSREETLPPQVGANMRVGTVFMTNVSGHHLALALARPGEAALMVPLTVEVGFGVRGQALRDVDIADGEQGSDLATSAQCGASLAHALLVREKYLDRTLLVRFVSDVSLANLAGRSADLAFALALVARLTERAGITLPTLVATGELAPSGAVLAVGSLAAKLEAALEFLRPGGVFVFPAMSLRDISSELAARAASRHIRLLPVERFEEALAELGVPLSQSWVGSPFRGLAAFDFSEAAIFFGRDEEIDQVLALLARRRASGDGRAGVLIEGVSGAGKSSLARAGVLPALVRRGLPGLAPPRWRQAVIVPDDILGGSITDETGNPAARLFSTLASQWTQHGDAVCPVQDALALVTSLQAANLHPVLLVDQLEQAWACADVAKLAAFVDLLADCHAAGMILLATITRSAARSLSDHPRLAGCFRVEGVFALTPPGPARLQAIVEEPAQAAGLLYESGLVAELLAGAAHGGDDVLPLLELLLTALYQRRDRESRMMRLADYHALGGLDGIIAASLAEVTMDWRDGNRATVERLLWKLASARELALADYREDDPLRHLATSLCAKRLLTRDRREDSDIVRAAHEALLRFWPFAVSWHKLNEQDIIAWQQLMIEARQWSRSERSLIPAGPQLAAAKALVDARCKDWTSGDETLLRYVRASERARLTRRRVLAGGAVLVAGALATEACIALWRSVAARYETRVGFDGVRVPPPDYRVAAAPWLKRFGISVIARDPDRAHLQIVANSALYDGNAVDPSTGENVLTLVADPGAAPMSYTLGFARSARAVELVRVGLWAATASGVTHPAWSAEALDSSGKIIARIDEPLLRLFTKTPPRRFRLESPEGHSIASLRISSDYRLHGKPFAGSQAVILSEIVLQY